MSEINSALTQLEIPKRKRGRPRKQPQVVSGTESGPPAKTNNDELINLLREQMKSQQDMMNRALTLAENSQSTMREWMQLFIPSNQPNVSTTLDEREKAEEEGWVPLPSQTIADVMKAFTSEELDYAERMTQ